MMKKFALILFLFVWIWAPVTIHAAEENKQVEFQHDANYPPYSYMKGIEVYGFTVDLTNTIFQQSPYPMTYSADLWYKVKERVLKGNIDSCGLTAMTPENKQDILFSVPVLKTSIAAFTRKNVEPVSIESLTKYRIGVGRGNYPEYILSKKLNITAYTAFENTEECVRALESGDIDVIFEDEQVINYLLVKTGLKGDIVPNRTSLFPIDVAFGVSKSNPQLVTFLNKRIRELQNSGVYETLYVSHFLQHSDHYTRYERLKVTVIIISVTLITLIIFLSLNTYIKSLRTKLQKTYYELRKQHEWVNIAYNIASATNTCSDLQTLILYIHQALGTIINTKNFYIALYDPHQDMMHFPYLVDETMPDTGYADTPSRKFANGITEHVIKTDRTLLLNNQNVEEMALRGEIEIFGQIPMQWLGTPLKIDNQAIGMIAVQSYTDDTTYTLEDMELMKFVSSQIAIAINRKKFEETINHMAYYDALTDMPNRILFNDRLKLALVQAKRTRELLAVLFLDLDHFKNINDSLGHGLGDKLLQEVSQRLSNTLREGDTIARLGGDEFTVILPQLKSIEDAALVADKIIENLTAPFFIEGVELTVTVSIGISVFPMDGEDAETLIKNADTALYRAKENGRNGYQLYTATMNATVFKRFSLETKLRHAIKDSELEVYYQPQADMQTGNITGMEALVRWNHPDLGLVPPSDFIPIAEESGLIVLIDEFVMEAACRKNMEWHSLGFGDLTVSVNISARHFQNRKLIDTVKRVLHTTGLPPQYLQLELTEGTLMEDVDYTLSILESLKKLGVNIALDDFGTGYSSLGYLKRFPIDTLKIDRSFVNNVHADSGNATITSAVIALAQNLQHKIVAEGVETIEEFSFLKYHNCEQVQGYLLSRPIPASQFEELLRTYTLLKV